MKIKPFIISAFLLLALNGFGQIPGIDSVKILPATPLAGDEVRVICYTVFPSGDCEPGNHFVMQNGNQILLNIEYAPGMLSYICHHTDTLSLGNQNAGDYELVVNLIKQPMGYSVDLDTSYFTVGDALGLPSLSASDLSVYPNPFNQELRVKAAVSIKKAVICSLSGQNILTLNETVFKSGQPIPVPELKSGTYLLILTDENENNYTQRIIRD